MPLFTQSLPLAPCAVDSSPLNGSDTPPNAAAFSRTWAEVNVARVTDNARALVRYAQRLAAGSKSAASGDVMAVVKADAYGHGALPVVRAAEAGGVTHFGVATLAEAEELRRAGVRAELYLLSPFLPREAEAVVRADVTPMVSSPEQLAALISAAERAPLPARLFLVVDTGMGREGALAPDALHLWNEAKRSPDAVRVTGLATHLSSADDLDDDGCAATSAQWTAFGDWLRHLAAESGLYACEDGRGNRGVYVSIANSPGALGSAATMASLLADLPVGAVRGALLRPGLLLYGIEPYRAAFDTLPAACAVRPVLSWRARITLIRDLPTGASVGYGRTHTLARPSRIATVAAGYADGLSRRLGNRGAVLLHGARFPLVGRVSMDQCQINITDARHPVTLGDAVTLIGDSDNANQTVHHLSELTDTTPHEITCALSRRVARVYVRDT